MRTHSSSKKPYSGVFRLCLVLLGLLTVLSNSAFAPPAQQCESRYVVHFRETTEEIAQKLLIDLDDLLEANDLTVDDRIRFGDVLCIPLLGRAGEPVITLSESVKASHTNYTISLNAVFLGPDTKYVVQVLTSTDPLEWLIFGQVEPDVNGTVKESFTVPGRLRGARNITICLLNKLSEASVCTVSQRTAVYDVFVPTPNFASNDEFSVTINKSKLTVVVTDLINEHVYYVRIREVGSSEAVRIGSIAIDGKGEATKTFNIPEALEGATPLEVCLKNVYNDDAECLIVTVEIPR
ncbi:MAG: LysM peptidoglycan-binding domain-containing protein [Chloroflexi bacterium]|nr:MAG: LysM peptidoglycan-binding domain-containing protein [Chloroflexota bacterium]MBL1195281.1 LysM peptidoglycan-binding domain-containing protein [Chloroflexota bacterium]NOH12565.1 LysM peptidoglycan-binding domain-containing protein [Chloroflexota bacterium]